MTQPQDRLVGRLMRREALDARDVRVMYELLSANFEGVDMTTFESDLSQKNWVVLIESPSGQWVGFSTILFHCVTLGGKRAWVVYSGDTIVDPGHWGTTALPSTWIDSVWCLHEMHGGGPLWWLLISSGYRTYRYLPLLWQRFYPRYDMPTPPQTQAILDKLAVEQFGDQYDRSTGVVRLARPHILRSHVAGIPQSRRRNPHVAFFEQANPGHTSGDELVCLTELSESNLTRAGWRMVHSGRQRDVWQVITT